MIFSYSEKLDRFLSNDNVEMVVRGILDVLTVDP
ncbi:unknown [Tannerella sp. CAG:118]|uniref:Uncharacterized protein n=1 Tax=Coprobacter secundus subsp. similis TaxID=2751153 RepID=A0A7G1HQQ9_9BACT|nr:hypothetical protein Cop2CBH44_03480 [Coprobacter secundus subsp. similis]CCY36747.1 unknown [Tannerella sp. CAG:118]